MALSIALVTGSAHGEIYEINMNIKIEGKRCHYFHISAMCHHFLAVVALILVSHCQSRHDLETQTLTPCDSGKQCPCEAVSASSVFICQRGQSFPLKICLIM